METPLDPFESPRTLLEWARAEHNELHRQFEKFVEGKPFRDVIEHDAVTHVGVRKIQIVGDMPVEWRRMAYQAAVHIRSAFDHVIAAGIAKITGQYPEKVMLPFSSGPTDLNSRLGKFPKEFHPFIRELQIYPTGANYKGGDDILCGLNRIANTNKHVSALQIGISLGEMVTRNVALSGQVKISGKIDREDRTIELFSWIGSHDIEWHFFIPLKLQFADLGNRKGASVIDMAQHGGQKAEAFLLAIEAECERIGQRV